MVAFLCENVALGFTLNGVHQQKRYIMEIRYLDICVMIKGSQGIQKQKRIYRNVTFIELRLTPSLLVIIIPNELNRNIYLNPLICKMCLIN